MGTLFCEIKMNSKICLILFGLLVALAVLGSAENSEEKTLSEEVASTRLAREAEAEAGKKKIRKNKSAKKSRKSRKNRKNKSAKKSRKGRKGRKNSRKNRKNKPSKKSRKERKERKRTNKNRSGRTLTGDCLEDAITAMKRTAGVVANFKAQNTRIPKHTSIAGNKGGKKGVFGPIAHKLVDLGGGNKSALACSGSATSDGAKRLTNLTSILFACETEVEASCNTNFPAPNKTFVAECANDVSGFENTTTQCIGLSKAATAADACSCWTNSDFVSVSAKVAKCVIPETAAVAKSLKACKDAFSKCRKYEDAAVSAMAACSVPVNTLKSKAAALYKNKENAAKVVNAVDTKVSARVSITSCADFIKQVAMYINILQSFPSSPKVLTIGGYIISAPSAITCTASEKTSLKAAEATLKQGVAFLEQAFNDVQSTLEGATGSTMSSSELTAFSTAAPTESTATTKASRFRMKGFQRHHFKA